MKPRKPTIIITETSIINQLMTILLASLQVLKNILADTYPIFLISAVAKTHQKVLAMIAEIRIEILRDIIIIIEGSMIKY